MDKKAAAKQKGWLAARLMDYTPAPSWVNGHRHPPTSPTHPSLFPHFSRVWASSPSLKCLRQEAPPAQAT